MGCALGFYYLLHYCLLVDRFQLGNAGGREQGWQHLEVNFRGTFGAEMKGVPGWKLSVEFFPEGEVEIEEVPGTESSGVRGNEV